jgi:8-oxo-dGTP pyrophosphatase MutT (NUDIX family)
MQSYKLFYKNARLLITSSEQNYQTQTDAKNCFLFHNFLDLTQIFSNFLTAEQDFDLLYATQTEENQIKTALCDFFIFQRAAGGIVFKGDALLSIFRLNRWDFPKGHVEDGETDADAALRETTEETGIDNLTIEKDLDYTYHIFKIQNNRFVLKQTHWYQMRTASEKTPVPQTEEGIFEAKWIPFSQRDVIVENTYRAMAELLGRVVGCKLKKLTINA